MVRDYSVRTKQDASAGPLRSTLRRKPTINQSQRWNVTVRTGFRAVEEPMKTGPASEVRIRTQCDTTNLNGCPRRLGSTPCMLRGVAKPKVIIFSWRCLLSPHHAVMLHLRLVATGPAPDMPVWGNIHQRPHQQTRRWKARAAPWPRNVLRVARKDAATELATVVATSMWS